MGLFPLPARRPGARRLLFFDGSAGAAQVLPEGAGRVGGALGQVVIEGGLLAQRLAFPDPAGLVPLDFTDLARGGQHRAGLSGRHEHDAVIIGEDDVPAAGQVCPEPGGGQRPRLPLVQPAPARPGSCRS